MPFIHNFVSFKIETLINPESYAGVAGFVGDRCGNRSFQNLSCIEYVVNFFAFN